MKWWHLGNLQCRFSSQPSWELALKSMQWIHLCLGFPEFTCLGLSLAVSACPNAVQLIIPYLGLNKPVLNPTYRVMLCLQLNSWQSHLKCGNTSTLLLLPEGEHSRRTWDSVCLLCAARQDNLLRLRSQRINRVRRTLFSNTEIFSGWKQKKPR